MSGRFWHWFLFVVACLDMGIGIATDKHYLVTDGLILLALCALFRIEDAVRNLGRRDP